MPKESTGAQESGRPRLRKPILDARAVIAEQINKGELVLAGAKPGTDTPAFVESSHLWTTYTQELLSALFTTNEIADEFRGPTYGPHGSLADSVRFRLLNLRAISNRLEVFKEALDVVEQHGKGTSGLAAPSASRDVFVVHGHDEGIKQTVARFLEQLNLKPIILHEQPNKGRTVIQKFRDHSNVGFAVVLLTPDDAGRAQGDTELQKRARQNVIFELGFFLGLLGDGHVCALNAGVEIPSDFAGVLYESLDSGGGWKLKLAREMKAAGLEIDLNLAI